MSLRIGREATVTNPLKNNLRPLPRIDSSRAIEINDGTTVLVLDGPVVFEHKGAGGTIDIPFWVVRVLEGPSKNRVGWMAEVNQSGKTILVGI